MKTQDRYSRTTGLMTLLAAAVATPVLAGEASCDYSEQLKADNSVVISVNTGAILSSSTEFSSHKKRVDIYFVAKNPFGFTYEYDVKGTRVEDGIIESALLKIGGLVEEKKAAVAAESTTKDDNKKPEEAPTGCGMKESTDVEGAYRAADIANSAGMNELEKQSKSFNGVTAEFDSLLGDIVSDTPKDLQSCSSLKEKVTRAGAFESKASAPLQAVEAASKVLGNAIATLKDSSGVLEAAIKKNGITSGKCVELLDDAKKKLVNVDDTTKKLSALKTAMAEKIDLIKGNNAKLNDAMSHSDAFIAQYPIGPASEPMSYAVSIKRTPIKKDDKDKVDTTTIPVDSPILLGSSRFSFSAGAAYAFGTQKTYARQASIVNDEVVNVVGVTDDSRSSVGAVGQLNAKFADLGPVSVMWSLGASMTQGETGTQFGFYTGPTLAAVGDKLFFTLAYHLRSSKKLSGGFKVGDVVPDDLEGDIPTTNKTRGALLLSVTYKVQK